MAVVTAYITSLPLICAHVLGRWCSFTAPVGKDGNVLVLGSTLASRKYRSALLLGGCPVYDIRLVMPLDRKENTFEKLNVDSVVFGGGCRSVAVAFFV